MGKNDVGRIYRLSHARDNNKLQSKRDCIHGEKISENVTGRIY